MKVVVTELPEVEAKLVEICGPDCPSHEMQHIEMDMEAFAALLADPQAFGAKYGIPLEPGQVSISITNNTVAAAGTSRTICCTHVIGGNSLSCFIWPTPALPDPQAAP